MNLLKGAIVTADAVTAVSPTYAQELKYAYFAHGLESVMQMVEGKLHGVLNGIDMERYDPASDPNLTANYSLRRMAGKAKDKAALQRMMGLCRKKGHARGRDGLAACESQGTRPRVRDASITSWKRICSSSCLARATGSTSPSSPGRRRSTRAAWRCISAT